MSLSCPICGGVALHEFLRRTGVPVHQNVPAASQRAAIDVPRGDLVMTACRDCGFVFNAAFDEGKLAYGADYENAQSHSPFFLDYMQGLARRLVDEAGVRDSRIVEVGCGKGEFLRLLVADPSLGNRGIGFDTSYVGPEADLAGRLRFERRHYDGACVDVPADVVVCRHVIEHVREPLVLLDAVRRALARAAAPRVYFETPCVEWILRNGVIWDFFYEHCSLFSAGALRHAFERAGFEVTGQRHEFGGQYLWLEARPVRASATTRPHEPAVSELAESFARDEAATRRDWIERIGRLAATGPVAIWGAGAKGTTFANLVDPERRLVDCLVDLNPAKQGRFVPGSGHPIVAPDALATRGLRYAILMNPNYRAENEALLRASRSTLELIE